MSAARAKAAFINAPEKGLYVIAVTPNGIAEKAGLVKGDVITSFGGRVTNDLTDLAAAQAATKPGSTVKVGLSRNGDDEEISVSFPMPDTKPAAKPSRKTGRTAT